jgi:hypothetical protein
MAAHDQLQGLSRPAPMRGVGISYWVDFIFPSVHYGPAGSAGSPL